MASFIPMTEVATWYHGTRREFAGRIAVLGLRAKAYGGNYQGSGFPYHVLARKRHQALLVDVDTVITLHIPRDETHEFMTCANGQCWCQGLMSGLMRPLPVRMVYAIECVLARCLCRIHAEVGSGIGGAAGQGMFAGGL